MSGKALTLFRREPNKVLKFYTPLKQGYREDFPFGFVPPGNRKLQPISPWFSTE
jgi:hypothetical protein